MDLLQLKYFKTVAKYGKINKAAESLYISSPALSSSISRLEKDLGMQLFRRCNNRLVLNEQGKIFLDYVNNVFASLDAAREDLKASLEGRKPSVVVGLAEPSLWADMFDAFYNEHPDIIISAVSLKSVQMFDTEQISRCAFILAEKADINLEMKSALLFQDTPYVALPAADPLAAKEYITPEELADMVMFWPETEVSLYKRIQKIFVGNDIAVKNVWKFPMQICINMVKKSRGISLVSKHAVQISEEICYVPLRCDVTWETRIFWETGRVLSRDEQTFQNFAINYFQNDREPTLSHYEYYLYGGV